MQHHLSFTVQNTWLLSNKQHSLNYTVYHVLQCLQLIINYKQYPDTILVYAMGIRDNPNNLDTSSALTYDVWI